jgi:hypothetical protein
MTLGYQDAPLTVAEYIDVQCPPSGRWTLQRQTLNFNLRRRIVQDVPFGMALEGLAAADPAYQDQAV